MTGGGGGGGVGIVLQARMGSTRLPGKVLRPLGGLPLLAWAIGRLATVRGAAGLVVATSTLATDDAVADLARACNAEVFRGDEADVLERYCGAAAEFGFDHVLRATGDNPFVDAEEAGRLIAAHLAACGGASPPVSYSVNFGDWGGGLPIGVGVEILSRQALEDSRRDGLAPHHREHVNEFVQENPQRFPFQVLQAAPEKRCPGLRLTVDTADDFRRAEILAADHSAACPDQAQPQWPDTRWLIAAARRHGWADAGAAA